MIVRRPRQGKAKQVTGQLEIFGDVHSGQRTIARVAQRLLRLVPVKYCSSQERRCVTLCRIQSFIENAELVTKSWSHWSPGNGGTDRCMQPPQHTLGVAEPY